MKATYKIVADSPEAAEVAAERIGGELMVHFVNNDPALNPGPMIYLPGQETGEGIPVEIQRGKGQPRLSTGEETITARVPMPESMHKHCMAQPGGLAAYIRSLVEKDVH